MRPLTPGIHDSGLTKETVFLRWTGNKSSLVGTASVSSRRSPPKLPDFQNPKYCWDNLQSTPSYQGSLLWHHTLHQSCHLYSRVDPKGHFIDTDSCVRRKLKPKKSGHLCILVKVTLWLSQLPEKVKQKPLKTVPALTDPESTTSNQAWKNSNNA